jgi:hypothetical protein
VRSIHDSIQAKLNDAFEGAKDYQPKVGAVCMMRVCVCVMRVWFVCSFEGLM